jgi:hypothetical protein
MFEKRDKPERYPVGGMVVRQADDCGAIPTSHGSVTLRQRHMCTLDVFPGLYIVSDYGEEYA